MTNMVLKFIKTNLTSDQALAASQANLGTIFFNLSDATIYLNGETYTGQSGQRLTMRAAAPAPTVTGISISEQSLEMRVGEAQTVYASPEPEGVTDDIYFKILDTNIATMEVINTGLIYITSVSVGETQLVVWCGSIMIHIPITITE